MTVRRNLGVALRGALLATAAIALGGSAALAQSAQALKEITADKAKVAGSIVVDYNSRSERSNSGADVYEIGEIAVADMFLMKGTVQRMPGSKLVYSVRYDVINPSNPSQIARDVAILRGEMAIDNNGRYTPETGQLRLDVVKGNQVTSKVAGSIQGRQVTRWWEVGELIRKAKTEATKVYSRYVDGKVVSIQVKNPDPLRFERLILPSGPFSFLPETRVSGNLDYDYELGNWLTDQNGVTMTYTLADKSFTDRITGSIRYVEEEGNFTDSKGKKREFTGYYDYNLRWNEQQASGDNFFDESTAAAQTDAFFSASDQTKPGLYGRVYYLDSEDACKRVKNGEGGLDCVGPTRSEITYDLKAVKLNYQQLASWMKLELLVIGPFTDE
ncbi:hypothetical protein [Bosea sp. 117]|uniref:hypothetical protein n=1 Tax=Bosea sp. 117 TaxID=1125973 RepID=UPI0004946493|nr:hypothetical protein [Bosea sp. 117]